jgi:hypothetical protein
MTKNHFVPRPWTLTYTPEELLGEHAYAAPQVIAGLRCHGGFDAAGRYVSPRTLGRAEACERWAEALRARGGEPFGADASLLEGVRFPTPAQQRVLLGHGLARSFWNSLTIIGKIEARGRVLADLRFPEFQDVVADDISGWALGHLNRGMLRAHGLDEGGEPERGIGGHDAMWFALRDLAFGRDAFPDVEPPARIGRDAQGRELPDLPAPHEQAILFLMNLLIIEFRAELGFAFTEDVLRDPALFADRRARADEAAHVVGRIRQDEEIHTASLCLYLGELRACTLRTAKGLRRGGELLDPIWDRMVHWATVEQPRLAADEERARLARYVLSHPDGEAILAEVLAI